MRSERTGRRDLCAPRGHWELGAERAEALPKVAPCDPGASGEPWAEGQQSGTQSEDLPVCPWRACEP